MPEPRLTVVVGSGGVGKTTVAAALGLSFAGRGVDTLVMTFDPSLRLKDALGVSEAAARDAEVVVASNTAGVLHASLLDPKRTFDRLVARYAPDPESRDRILRNRYYRQLSGSLAGILEYMAVERLYEVERDGRHERVILDTPPTRQALDFLEAPRRIVGFLDSGALRVAARDWFDDEGRLKATSRWGGLGRSFESWLDTVVGLDLLRDMAEFFQAFGPLYRGFRERALEVEALLRSPRTGFVLVGGPGQERIPDLLYFARKLGESGLRLDALVVNRVHPGSTGSPGPVPDPADGAGIVRWLGAQDRRGLEQLASLVPGERTIVTLPLLPDEPSDLPGLGEVARELEARLGAAGIAL